MILAPAAVNPDGLTGIRRGEAHMSRRPETMSCEPGGRRWARLESADLIGNCCRGPTLACDRPEGFRGCL
jgi:hypothetical protein